MKVFFSGILLRENQISDMNIIHIDRDDFMCCCLFQVNAHSNIHIWKFLTILFYFTNFRSLDLFKEFPCEEFRNCPDAIDFTYYG